MCIMFKNKLSEDSPIPKFIHLKIRRRDDVVFLTTLEEGEFKVPIDGCISQPWIMLNLILVEINPYVCNYH